MSGSIGNIFTNLSSALHLHGEALTRLQEQAATGSRINRPSDDPSTAFRVLGLESQKRLLENYMDNITNTISTLEISSNIVNDMTSIIVEKKVSLTQIIGGIYDENGRERLAGEIDDALEQMVLLANTRHTGQYLFGGNDTSSAPYVVQRTDGLITSVTYQGSSENRDIEIADGMEAGAFCVGDDIFRSDNRGTPVFTGDTGAAAGTGTSSVKGYVWLTVTDNNPSDGTYELSIDDGLTSVNADGTANQAITDSRTGEVLYVDTTGINSTGVDMVRVPGTCDIFNIFISVRDILKNERGLSDTQLTELINNSIEPLEEVRSLLVEKGISINARIGFLDDIKDTLENTKFSTIDEATILQEADITQLAIDISRREMLYQMSLSVAGRLMSMSLLDFIQ